MINKFPTQRLAGTRSFCQKSSCWWLIIVGGLLFTAIFYARYYAIPDDFYTLRDDGVITLSHAKNLIEYGFIGVNPSGERVEGYSAPVQFFIFAGLYALTGLSFYTYIQLQTLVCTFALGACFISFMEGKYSYRIAATAIGATLLAAQTTFIEWHGSGMENPITHVLFLSTMLVLYSAMRSGKIRLWQAIIPLLASISRLESIYYIAPLIALFCFYWHNVYKTPKALQFAGIVFGGWVMFMAWRYMYFGSLIPNTAIAQGINIMQRIKNWQFSINETFNLSKAIMTRHGIYSLAILAPMLFFLTRQPTQPTKFLILMFLCTFILTYFHTFFFGEARMDAARTTTHFAICVALASSLLILHSQAVKPILASIPLLAAICWTGLQTESMTQYKIGWGTSEFKDYLRDINNTALKEHIPRATIANVDLGMMSWFKLFNIVDLGKLGSPIMATLESMPNYKATGNIENYFFEFAAPDIVESHDIWGCENYNIYHDPRFRALYKPVRQALTSDDCKGKETLSGVWVRKDMLAGSASAERLLVNSLLSNLSVKRIEDELAKCELSESGNCAYVARSAYRFLPEFRKQGTAKELSSLFSRSKHIPQFGYYLMNGAEDATSYKEAIDEILRYKP